MKEFYTPQELAERWDMSYQYIMLLLRNGEIKGFKIGKRNWRIKREEVERIENDG